MTIRQPIDLPDLSHLSRWVRWRVRLGWLVGFRASVRLHTPDWGGPSWFNLGVGTVHVYFPSYWRLSSLCIFPFNAFNRVFKDESEDCYGFGLLQINGRHLVAVIKNSEKFLVDVAFTHVVYRTPEGGGA